MGTITLIIGGARSGKSAFALQHGKKSSLNPRLFIATAEILDEEMKIRAENHVKERGTDWTTIEEPYNLAEAISNLPSNATTIIDCCTVWLGNTWHKYGSDEITLSSHIDSLCSSLEQWTKYKDGELLIVTNEVGWGIIPLDAGVRRYRDWAGKLNQRVASIANEVILCVAGIPLYVKGKAK